MNSDFGRIVMGKFLQMKQKFSDGRNAAVWMKVGVVGRNMEIIWAGKEKETRSVK